MNLGPQAVDTFKRFPGGVVQAILLRQRLGSQTSEINGLGNKAWRITFVAPGLCESKVSLSVFRVN